MTMQVSLMRLYALRAGYLLLAVGLGLTVWPGLFHHATPWTLSQGVSRCLLAAIAAMAVLGLKYPLKMLPLLFFEMAWKVIWLVVVALPLWMDRHMDVDTLEATYECLGVVIFPLLIPWRYVLDNFMAGHGDRWR